jgi:hypothetical protein
VPPVHILGLGHHPGATLGREIMLTVDRRSLLDLLEDAIPASAPSRQWPEKGDARVAWEQLHATAVQPGEYAVLTCAHCEVPQDLVLAPFVIRHEGEFVVWRVAPPGADIRYHGEHELELRFHRAQYEAVLARASELRRG